MHNNQKAATANIDWDATGIMAGIIIGVVSASAVITKWVILPVWKSINRPSIKFERGPYAINRDFQNQETWRFVSIEVKNRRNETARRCVATAIILKQPNNVKLVQEEFSLHWADVPFNGRSTGADPVDIAGGQQRLDIAFTTPNHSKTSSVAMPVALSMSGQAPQAILPSGEYILQINISCENGSGDAMKIKLISPDNGQDLRAEKIR
jgi:hypothetical protein